MNIELMKMKIDKNWFVYLTFFFISLFLVVTDVSATYRFCTEDHECFYVVCLTPYVAKCFFNLFCTCYPPS
ncbi:unnamed protein product [Trifolium pratense]|uniref:Uncharacterized protein n=1 Tax=Trifolium pratense TaxID=57577 RepID=A0ACB0K4B7_TRIPR|nr:unnamed protein product [Trifolium pratense]